MPGYRPPARRRRRRIRVVAPAAPLAALDGIEMSAWGVGLEALALLHRFFPEVGRSLGDAACTTDRLFGVALCALRLVEQRGLDLAWPPDLLIPDVEDDSRSPQDLIDAYEHVEPWIFTDILDPLIQAPRPIYYGLGVVGLYDGVASEPDDPLALLLWHLFNQTGMGIGLPIADLLSCIDPAIARLIQRQTPLDADAPTRQIAVALAQSLPEQAGLAESGTAIGNIVWYAFGATTNPLANLTCDEAEMMEDRDEDWDHLDRLIAQQQEAWCIAEAYRQWRDRVASSPAALIRLARQIRRLAREITQEEQRGCRTLIDVLTATDVAAHIYGDEGRYTDGERYDWI